VVKAKGGRVLFTVENYGDSELARRFGVTRYPAIFVDDVLVATPKDFGFYGQGEGEENGRYAPWRANPASYERFRADLDRMIELVLAGKRETLREEMAGAGAETLQPAALPALDLAALDGSPLTSAAVAGKVVLVEFWATGCPPCRGTLQWLGELKARHGDRLEVVALAVDSDEADVRRIAGGLGLPLRWAMGSPELARKFGDLSAVPTLFVFDSDGTTREIFFGAPPDLHERAERALAALLARHAATAAAPAP
jgi:thiol-disulfide isomerase/thioredoxin